MGGVRLANAHIFQPFKNKNMIHLIDEIEIANYGDNYNVICADGYAVALNDEYILILKYPKLAELTDDQKREALEYRGIESGDCGFDDAMMRWGKVTQVQQISTI